VLYEAVSGRRAFEVKEERSAALDKGPAPALDGKVPRALARLVGRCLEKDPEERPTAAQAAEDLLAAQRQLGRPRAVRRTVLLASAALAVGVALAVGYLRMRARLPAVGADGRVVVAVADFANDTKDPELDGLSLQLVTSLEQSRALRVLTRSRMSDILRQLGKWSPRTLSHPYRPALLPRGLLHAALAHERLGDREKARARVDDFLRRWRRADPDLPMLAEAKALRRRLEAAGPATPR
jgi:hypothetical protein